MPTAQGFLALLQLQSRPIPVSRYAAATPSMWLCKYELAARFHARNRQTEGNQFLAVICAERLTAHLSCRHEQAVGNRSISSKPQIVFCKATAFSISSWCPAADRIIAWLPARTSISSILSVGKLFSLPLACALQRRSVAGTLHLCGAKPVPGPPSGNGPDLPR